MKQLAARVRLVGRLGQIPSCSKPFTRPFPIKLALDWRQVGFKKAKLTFEYARRTGDARLSEIERDDAAMGTPAAVQNLRRRSGARRLLNARSEGAAYAESVNNLIGSYAQQIAYGAGRPERGGRRRAEDAVAAEAPATETAGA